MSYRSANLLYKDGEYKQALDMYLNILNSSSHNEKLLILIANCYDHLEQKELAIKFYERAHKYNKRSIVPLVNLSIIYNEINKNNLAYKYALRALRIDENNSSANFVIGNVLYSNSEYMKAISYYNKSLEQSSHPYLAYINIANSYLELRDYKRASEFAKEAHSANPEKSTPFMIIGNIYKELEEYTLSKKAYEKSLSLNNKNIWVYNYLSQVYQNLKEFDKALEAAYIAVKLSDGNSDHQLNMGYIVYEVSLVNYELAKEYATKWLEEYPSNEIVTHMGNAVLNNAEIEVANDEYLKKTFDVFANDFDEVLSDLEYRAPKLIYDALVNVLGNNPKRRKILDAGCGTGLCGKYLKPFALRWRGLYGVDISRKMLERAKDKRIYDRLYEKELVEFLYSKIKTYDLIVSADVFTYFGDFSKLFSSLYFALRYSGKIVFTVSENNINDSGYYFHNSGRFIHSREYVEQMLYAKGFDIELCSREWLRNEGGEKVYGYVFVATRRKNR